MSKTTSPKPTALIYCDHLLPYSATFVRSQAEALKHFTPHYIGCRLIKGLSLPAERTSVISQGGISGKVSETFYKLWGMPPAPFVHTLKAIKPSLLHAHFGPDGLRALPLARQLRLPLVVTFHGYDATVKDEYARRSSLSHRTYLKQKSLLQQEARIFIAVSEFIKKKLLDQGFPSNKIFVHYVGVDTTTFTPDPGIPREPVVLFVGRLVEKKGCEYLIRAMGEVQRVQPEAELVVIGDGPLRSDLEKLSKETLKRYRFLGAQSPETVRSWMNRAKVFSVPSIIAESGDAEAFGIVFAEAQAMGLPVVSFASGGIPEAVAHGKTGFLAAERDWQSLASSIVKLLDDSALWDSFSQTGRERIQAAFDLHQQTRALETIYETALR